eukprot:GHVU01167835.1.p1 GENE.GHVU01167835.1~~GHVU01167835.1.p1  ORF type:complete len:248 (+),score=34.90 GHVU01167835.1:898-1641(+)
MHKEGVQMHRYTEDKALVSASALKTWVNKQLLFQGENTDPISMLLKEIEKNGDRHWKDVKWEALHKDSAVRVNPVSTILCLRMEVSPADNHDTTTLGAANMRGAVFPIQETEMPFILVALNVADGESTDDVERRLIHQKNNEEFAWISLRELLINISAPNAYAVLPQRDAIKPSDASQFVLDTVRLDEATDRDLVYGTMKQDLIRTTMENIGAYPLNLVKVDDILEFGKENGWTERIPRTPYVLSTC